MKKIKKFFGFDKEDLIDFFIFTVFALLDGYLYTKIKYGYFILATIILIILFIAIIIYREK